MIIEKILLTISLISMLVVSRYLFKKRKTNKLYLTFLYVSVSICIMVIGMILQIFLKDVFDINEIFYEYITYAGGCVLPVYMLIFTLEFSNKNINNKHIRVRKFLPLFIIPLLSILLLWTNDLHHGMFEKYEINISDSQVGWYFPIHSIYTYAIFIISIAILIRTTLQRSGFFSIQTFMIFVGSLIPIIINILGTTKIISMTVYLTPIMFTGTAVCFALAIMKFKALNIIPVAFKTVVDTMSDSFVVISEDGTIADKNKTFENTFKDIMILDKKDNFFDIIKTTKIIDYNTFLEYLKEARDKNKVITKECNIKNGEDVTYFEVDIQGIKAKGANEYVASLLLFRNITAQKRDVEIMTKNENLVILGELAGGVAHDINTPISAIKSGLLMLKDTVKTDDEKMLVARMDSCADKIVNLVNSMRNQIRNIGSDEKTMVNIASVVHDTEVVVHNECVKHNVKINVNIIDDVSVMGNVTKLSQVITNLVMNAIQAYEEKGGIIDIDVYKSDKNEAKIMVEDYAGGIPERIRPNIFRNILTTKGVSGTGFGLYLAYSVIKGSFGGDMSFETETGKGTKFYITIPLEG